MYRPFIISLFVLMLVGISPGESRAADVTDVLSAFKQGKAWEGIAALRFVHTRRQALVVREWICNSADNKNPKTGKNPFCPDANRVIDTRQLGSSVVSNVLNVDLRAGLYHHLELYVTLPIVVGETSQLNYDEGVHEGNSLVTSPSGPSLMNIPFSGANRVGIGDTIIGIKGAPIHADRDRHSPSWVVGLEYLAPTGSARLAGDTGVGGGVHAVTVYTAISRKLTPLVEPYFKLHGSLRFAAADGPFQHERVTQTLVSPGHSMGLELGGEFYPWGDPKSDGSFVTVDLGLTANFTFKGRAFSEIFDALGSSTCSRSNGCNLTEYTRGERGPDGNPRRTDGVTDVEQFGQFGLRLGVSYQLVSFLKVRLGFAYEYVTSHFISFADAGKDLDGQGDVQHVNASGFNEYNPFYNQNYDDFGTRFRVDDSHAFQFIFSVQGQL